METMEVETRSAPAVAPGVWPVAWTAIVGGLGVLFASTTVAVAVEPLAGILGVPLSTVQWISTGYLLALAVVVPIVPWAQDRIGGRRLWIVGLAVFLVASLLAAVAWDAPSLIAFRALQGAAGGILMPMMATLVMQAAAGKGLGRVMAVVSMPAVLGPILGPALGGLVLDTLDRHWLFVVTVPFAVGGILMALRYLPKDEPTRPTRLDVVGFVLMALGLAGVLYGLSNASKEGGFGHPDVLAPLVAGVAAIALFSWRTLRRTEDPLIDLRLLRHGALSSSTVLLLLSGFALYGAMLLVPLYFQQLRGATALEAGLLLIPQGVGTLASRTVAVRLAEKVGARWVVLVGFVIVAVGTLPFLTATEHTSLVLISGFLLVRGLGLGAVTVLLMALAFEGLARDEVPHASVISRIGQQLGGSFGTAVLAVVLQSAVAAADTPADGFQVAFWWATGFTVAAVALSLLLPRRAV
ncbi:MDR family MFS transporter [Promicromonospora citrea]|uniref:MFS transporter n=1 Tax=Promicromonospora citrea TaxID=43677 RepID=A0A8H9L5T5_9MICO|nr:MDR family MFS transporter [Promicromonospora citrea]NNH52243.1 multidrug efflux MFS transporter [Promicromonospora citrea]GGM40105.1 MFS transporter [Promicromonospora citrea]